MSYISARDDTNLLCLAPIIACSESLINLQRQGVCSYALCFLALLTDNGRFNDMYKMVFWQLVWWHFCKLLNQSPGNVAIIGSSRRWWHLLGFKLLVVGICHMFIAPRETCCFVLVSLSLLQAYLPFCPKWRGSCSCDVRRIMLSPMPDTLTGYPCTYLMDELRWWIV